MLNLKKSLIGLVGILVLVGSISAFMPLVSRGQGNPHTRDPSPISLHRYRCEKERERSSSYQQSQKVSIRSPIHRVSSSSHKKQPR